MATIPGLGDEDEKSPLAVAYAGLSTQDKYEIGAQKRSISSAFQRGQRQYNTGLQTSENDRTLSLKKAVQSLRQNRQLGLSQAADTGLGWSPAVSGAAVAAAGQRYANQQAQAQQSFSTARAALERMLQEARINQAEGNAELTLDAARRRDYANEIRKYGSS